jgi:RNA polymerase sporulation-specific sigma factor
MSDFSMRKYRDVSDEDLAKKSSAGDEDALSALVARYVFCVRSRAANYLGSGIDLEDLSQEGMIGLIYAARHFDDTMGAKFRTYAWLCIDRSIISVVRASMQKKKIPKDSLILMGNEEDAFSSHKDNPEELVIDRENVAVLMQTVTNSLSDFEKQVLSLYLTGMKYADIANKLSSSQKAVDNAMQRIRRKLK